MRFWVGVLLAALLVAGCAAAERARPVSSVGAVEKALALAPSPSPEASATALPSATARPAETATARPTRRATATMIPTRTASPTAEASATAEPSATALPPTATLPPPPPTATVAAPRPTQPPAPTATSRAAAPTQPPAPPPPTQPPAPAPTQPPATTGAGLPQRLVIPRIGVNAPVEYVGKDAQGRMEVPAGWWNVGWYQPGFVPGQRGSAVMAGHFDSDTGRAVFWDLGLLAVGDEVTVVDVNGTTLRFRVTGKEIYRYDEAPLQRIFSRTDGTYLNLITCNGTFDQNARNYDKRLVVYTEYVGP